MPSPQTAGRSLAQQYLAALGPAGTAISTSEAKLKALPITASVAQVQAVVAPLPKDIGPLEALIQEQRAEPDWNELAVPWQSNHRGTERREM